MPTWAVSRRISSSVASGARRACKGSVKLRSERAGGAEGEGQAARGRRGTGPAGPHLELRAEEPEERADPGGGLEGVARPDPAAQGGVWRRRCRE